MRWARLESELRDARAALAKSKQQVTDLQVQLAKAGDVQALESRPGGSHGACQRGAQGEEVGRPQSGRRE